VGGATPPAVVKAETRTLAGSQLVRARSGQCFRPGGHCCKSGHGRGGHGRGGHRRGGHGRGGHGRGGHRRGGHGRGGHERGGQ